MEWKRKEKKVESTTATKYLYSFLMLFSVIISLFIQWFLFSCGEWSEISHARTHTAFWAMACREFLILNSIAHCSVFVDTMGPSKRFYSFYFYFCFVSCFSSLSLPLRLNVSVMLCAERMLKRIKWNVEKRAATCFKKLDRFNSFLFSCDAFEEKTSNRIR